MDEQNRPISDEGRPARGAGRIWAGLLLLVIGGVLLMDQLGFPFPDWLFDWPVLLIAIGAFLGLRNNFRGGAWFIMILIGSFFLIEHNFPHVPLHRFIWPAVLIFIGLLIIVRPHPGSYHRGKWWDEQRWQQWRKARRQQWRESRWQHFAAAEKGSYASGDYIDSTAIFGGIHKKIVSKDFKGGDVTSIMGGTELDFSQADINGNVRLEVTQIMGGTKIIVPSNWEVRSEVTSVFGGFEDKRQQPATTNSGKVLILEGTSIMGGIELKNY